MSITTEINEWQNGRTECLDREAKQGHRSEWADEIQSSDDEGTRLLTEAAPLIAAAEQLMAMDLDMWAMNATAFTCTEAEAIADLLRSVHGDQTATDFLHGHAEGDDIGDAHWHLNDGSKQ